MTRVLIAPSLLAANQSILSKEAKRVESAGADLLHIDVMDGRFVPRINYGLSTVKAIRRVVKIPLEVHLMIKEPWLCAVDYVKAGANRVCIHVEAGDERQVLDTLKKIKKAGAKAGLAIVPSTRASKITDSLIKACDYLLPMTVVPGYSGQEFLFEMVEKFTYLTKRMKKLKIRRQLESDGGINERTAPIVYRAGCTVFVAGAAIFSSPDAKKAIASLRRAANAKGVGV